jgi:hypothetical protein
LLLLSKSSPFNVELAAENLKSYKSQGTDKITAEPIQAEGEILRPEIHKFVR